MTKSLLMKRPPLGVHVLVASVALLVAQGCGSKDDEPRVAETPGQAASQLQGAFGSGNDPFATAARAASDALRAGDYPAAVDALQALKGSQAVTPQQGMAVHGSMVVLEANLISAMGSGDPKAKQAYERLKALKAK
jgi:hypothetical protein